MDLRKLMPGHECVTVQPIRAKGTQDGLLLKSIYGLFEVFITIDGNMQFQQNFQKFPDLAVIFLSAPSNTMEDLVPLLPAVQNALAKITPGQHIHISSHQNNN